MSSSEEESESKARMITTLSKAEQRKNNKPIMEKKRRARINHYLEELKKYLIVNEKDPTRLSKLEKADILELTVKRIRTLERQQLNRAVASDPAVLVKFRTGFSECATEVSRFVSSLENVDPAIKQRLVSHLNTCVMHLQQDLTPSFGSTSTPRVPYMPERIYPEVKVGFQSDLQNGDENNNGSSARIQIPSGVQLIPSRLPTGELALLVPQSAGISANFPFFPPAMESSVAKIGQSSAFTAVHRSQSPLLSPTTSTSSFGDESHHSEHPQAASPNHHQQPWTSHATRAMLTELNLLEASFTSSKSSSSSETQKPQISSESPPAFRESRMTTIVDENTVAWKDAENQANGCTMTHNSQRQPLSVITDATCQQASRIVWNVDSCNQNGSRRRQVFDDRLLAIRPRYQQPVGLSSSMNNDEHKSANEQSVAIDGPATRQNSPSPQNPDRNSDEFPTTLAPSALNANDEEPMWRPW